MLNADDPLVSTLERHAAGPLSRFGIADTSVGTATEAEIADALWDPASGDDFRYDHRFFAHLGHWYTSAGARRPTPEITADCVAECDERMHFDLRIAEAPPRRVELPAEGLYSVYNALAASAAATALGVAGEPIIAALGEHRAAFGRQEQLTVNGRRVRILLGKNPAGMNQALRTLQRARRAAPPARRAQRRDRRWDRCVVDLGHRLGGAGAALRLADDRRPAGG